MSYEPLNHSDRCDRCAARGLVRVEDQVGRDLVFCGHHYCRYSEMLGDDFTVREDARDRVLRPVEVDIEGVGV